MASPVLITGEHGRLFEHGRLPPLSVMHDLRHRQALFTGNARSRGGKGRRRRRGQKDGNGSGANATAPSFTCKEKEERRERRSPLPLVDVSGGGGALPLSLDGVEGGAPPCFPLSQEERREMAEERERC